MIYFDKNLSKKISAVSYWLEILETKIKDCSQSSSQDPTPVIFYLNEKKGFCLCLSVISIIWFTWVSSIVS